MPEVTNGTFMKTTRILAIGLSIMFILWGVGGCGYLICLGEKQPKKIIVEIPGILKEKK